MRPLLILAASLGLLLAVVQTATAAHEIESRVYRTQRVQDAPQIDGRLDDQAWDAVPWSGGFVQRQPEDGAQPTAQTELKLVYDDEALYLAFRAHDDPSLVTSRLARRDWFPGDWVEVNIDSRADRRTAYSFTLSLSGTRGDEYISEDGSRWDGNWDPVWSGATQIDDRGWTAEMRIPLSQLRFDPANPRPWGLQCQRRIFREGERSSWQHIPQDADGWVSRFGEIHGIEGLKPARRLEVMPYMVAQHERFEAEPGNPFRDGTDNRFSGGLDAKLGLGSDFSVDLTVNPDFGQVEADPSQVNLTAFETFFQEKRPFFIEGADVFRLPVAPAITGGHFTRDQLFYSRRIGGRPSYSPDLDDGEHTDVPDQASILGAAKITGKTADGWSVGLLESVTAEERADISGPGGDRDQTVEPLTNYLVGRVTRDLRDGDTVVGGMLTSVTRKIDQPHLEFLERQAWAGGVDLQHYLRGRDFRLNVRVLGSHLRGNEESILDVQTASARYFQRPDNSHADLDSTRTSLSGHAGSIMLLRTGNNTDFRWQAGGAWRSPGFEINDLGYMRRADEINQFVWAGYTKRNPFWIFNRWSLNANQWADWDFSGQALRQAVNWNTNGQLRSQHHFWGGMTRTFEQTSNTALRGGPSAKLPGVLEMEAGFNTDHRKPVQFNAGGWVQLGDHDSSQTVSLWTDLTYRPTNSLRVSLNPSYRRTLDDLQYVSTAGSDLGDRYLMGHIDQRVFSFDLRVDWSITPNLTVQYYGSPFVASGKYTDFKRITDPRAGEYGDRFEVFGGGQIAATDDGYDVDEDRDGTVDYTIDEPDFNVRDFNSNLVVRWEYSEGSTMYVVWSQSRSDYLADGRFRPRDDLDSLFRTHPENVFLVKFNRWFNL